MEIAVYDNQPLLIRKKKGNGVIKLSPQKPMYVINILYYIVIEQNLKM